MTRCSLGQNVCKFNLFLLKLFSSIEFNELKSIISALILRRCSESLSFLIHCEAMHTFWFQSSCYFSSSWYFSIFLTKLIIAISYPLKFHLFISRLMNERISSRKSDQEQNTWENQCEFNSLPILITVDFSTRRRVAIIRYFVHSDDHRK